MFSISKRDFKADASPWLHAGVQPASKKEVDTIQISF